MRTLNIILLIVVTTLTGVKSQPYRSILYSDTTKWTGYSCIIDAHIVLVAIAYRDTTINDTIYRVVEQYNVCKPSSMNIDGFLREDTLTGRVWYKDNYIGHELLIMDLTLKAGDVFNGLMVDSVYYSESRKVISLYQPFMCFKDDRLEFIEGIGPTAMIPFFSRLLLFKYNNSELVYTSPSVEVAGDDTYLCVTSAKYSSASGLASIQAVDKNLISIRIHEGNTDVLLSVISTTGQIVHTQRLNQGDNLIQLKVRGVHFFRIQSTNNVATFKIYLH